MVKFDDSVEYEMENQAYASGTRVRFNRCSGDDGTTGRNPTGTKFLRLLILSFGLLCLLQATLNVTLRLTLLKKRNLTDSCETMIKNMADENEKLKRTQNISVEYKQGWFYISNHSYYKSQTQESWQVSREDCLQKGADLMIINSREEQEFATNFKPVWIGLTDNETEGIWKWVDGTPLNTSYWHTDEPNNAGGSENCGELGYFGKLNSWNDKSCQYKNYWICEKVAI